MKERKPVEKQADRDQILLRINPVFKETVRTWYKGWGFNHQSDFYVAAVKDSIEKYLNNSSRIKDDETFDSFAYEIHELAQSISEIKSNLNLLNAVNEQNSRLLAILMTFSIRSSVGYLGSVNKEHLIGPIQDSIKLKLEKIDSLDLEQLIVELISKHHDGSQNRTSH